jgi:hypothetical protein
MTRNLIMTIGAFALATSLVAAQAQTTPPTQQTQPPQQQQEMEKEISLTGCLVQGSEPTVFILEDAIEGAVPPTDPTDPTRPERETEETKSYVVVADAEDLFLRNHLNHKVTIRGVPDETMVDPATPEKPVEEKDLPKLAAKSVLPVADTCTPFN